MSLFHRGGVSHLFPALSICFSGSPCKQTRWNIIFILTLPLRLLWQISNYTVKAAFKANLITFTERKSSCNRCDLSCLKWDLCWSEWTKKLPSPGLYWDQLRFVIWDIFLSFYFCLPSRQNKDLTPSLQPAQALWTVLNSSALLLTKITNTLLLLACDSVYLCGT